MVHHVYGMLVCRIISMSSCTSAVRRDWTTLCIASREYFTKAYSRPLTESGLIARSDPEHPNSPRQKYILAEEGRDRIRRVAPL